MKFVGKGIDTPTAYSSDYTVKINVLGFVVALASQRW